MDASLFSHFSFAKKFPDILAPCIFTYVALTIADSPIYCKTNVCSNNGTCLLASKSAAYQLCDKDESYYNGNCYKIFKEKKTWHEANEICKLNHGNLIIIESEFQKLFLFDYLLSNFENISAHNVTVWVADHLLVNDSQEVYAWMRNISVNNISFSENQQLQLIDGICIEIDSQSIFRDWILANCSDNNYFICSRPVDSRMDELENLQCMCRNGYSGKFCEEIFNKFDMTFESQSVACMSDELKFSCPSGGLILVDFAAYGNIAETNKICLNSIPINVNITNWEQCIHPSSLQTIISICQGFNHCRIKDFHSLFSNNPCLPTTPITLQYRMQCLFEPIFSCPINAIYQNGRCYIPHTTEAPLPVHDAQIKCRKKGGQLAFSVSQVAQNEIVTTVRKQIYNNRSFCYWMNEFERPGDNLLCDCFYIDSKSAFWSKQNCSSGQQWVCQFAPEILQQYPEIYSTKFPNIFNGLSNAERFG